MKIVHRNSYTYIALISILILFGVEHSDGLLNQADDAFISYQYAKNFIAGYGLVFNVGEYVEGYTNLLWVLLVAGVSFLGIEPHVSGYILSLLTSAALLIGCFLYSEAVLPAKYRSFAICAPIILYATNSFTHWSTAGLETPLFSSIFIFALIASHHGSRKWVVGLCIAAVLTRPDGGLLAAVLLLLPFLRNP